MKVDASKKAVLITGSSGLIGEALCEKFLAEDFIVYGLEHKAKNKISHPRLHALKCDLSKEQDIKRSVAKIPRLDVVINNAARTDLTFIDFDEVTLKQWNDGLAVNLTSFFLLAKSTSPLLKKTRGSLLNISSTRHLMSEPNTVIYSASKGGILSLTHSLAITLGPDVRVNCISPGWIADYEKEKLKKKDHDQHPAGRVGKPEDIAALAYFLSSDEATFITGSDFIVDGGMTRKMIYS